MKLLQKQALEEIAIKIEDKITDRKVLLIRLIILWNCLIKTERQKKIEEKSSTVPILKLPKLENESRLNYQQIIDSVLKYISNRINETIDKEENNRYIREIQGFKNLYNKIKTGEGIPDISKAQFLDSIIMFA